VPRAKKALRTLAELTAATAGLFFCVATSSEEQPIEPDPEPWPEEFDTDGWSDVGTFNAAVFLHNGTDRELTIRLRPLAVGADIECAAVAANPGGLLTSPLFGDVSAWTVEADANLPLDDLLASVGGCTAAILSVDGLPDTLLFYDPTDFLRVSVPARGEPDFGGVVAIRPDGGGLVADDGEAGLVHALVGPDGSTEPACEAASQAERLTWADPVPSADARIGAIEEGLDGCLQLDLDAAENQLPPWYVCVPVELFPFEVGDHIEIAETWEAAGRGLRISSLEDSRSLSIGTDGETVFGPNSSAAWRPGDGCELVVASECGTVVQAGRAEVQTEDSPVYVAPGEWVEQVYGGQVVRTYVAVAQNVAAVRSDCSEGPDAVGVDLSVAVATMGEQEQ
jgi:hypothetical protein